VASASNADGFAANACSGVFMVSCHLSVIQLEDLEVQEDPSLELSVAKVLMGVPERNPRVNVFLNGQMLLEGDDYEIKGNKLGFSFNIGARSVLVVQEFKKDGSITKRVFRG